MKISQEKLVRMINESIQKHIRMLKEDADDAIGVNNYGWEIGAGDGHYYNPKANKEALEAFAEQAGEQFFANLPKNDPKNPQFETNEDIARGLIFWGAFGQKPSDLRIYTTNGECFQWGDRMQTPSVRDGIIKIYDSRDAGQIHPQYLEPLGDRVSNVTDINEIIEVIKNLREDTAYYFNEGEEVDTEDGEEEVSQEPEQQDSNIIEIFGKGGNKIEVPKEYLTGKEAVAFVYANNFTTRGATKNDCFRYYETKKTIVEALKKLLANGVIDRAQYDEFRYHYYQDKGSAANKAFNKLNGR